MAELPFDESVLRFKDNEDRFDLFINDAVGYLTREGVSVESVQAFLARLETEILNGTLVLGIELVTELPTSPGADKLYNLTATDGLAPVGIYNNNGSGWRCLAQFEEIALSDWTGVVSVELYSGVEYTVSITAEVTSLSLTLTNAGTSFVVITNTNEAVVALPTSGFKMTYSGLYDLGAASARLSLQKTGSNYEWGVTAREII